MAAPGSPALEEYARSAAEGFLRSLAHYDNTCPSTSDGTIATPAWYANRLGKVLTAREQQLPGDVHWWWAARYAAYAHQVLGTSPTVLPAEPQQLS